MSRHGDIILAFGTEEHVFRLGIEQLRRIQERCDAGPPELLMRLAPIVRAIQAKLSFSQMLAAGVMGTWRIDDVREVLVQGLIGGGMGATEAGALVRSEFDEKLSFGHAPLAFVILQAAYSDVEDEPILGEPKAARKTPTGKPSRRSPKARSASQPSTAPGP